MNLPRPVVLCADDFGLTDGVSRGIVELVGQGRLSATGAMTNMPAWRRNAPALAPFRDRIGVGLHLNLTTGGPLGPMPILAPGGDFPPLSDLLRLTLLRQAPAAEIRDEIARQLDAFEQAHGAPPAFVDGHQHVHVLPGIRQALFEALAARSYGGLWLRDPSDALASVLRRRISHRKALVVRVLASGFRREARAAGFETNEGFSGFSPLSDTTDAAPVLGAALAHLGPKPVVMCHPGHVDHTLRGLDRAVESRVAELRYLASDDFSRLLEDRNIVLVARPGARPETQRGSRGAPPTD